MATNKMAFKRVGAMPASTWNFLKANDATVEVPQGLEILPDIRISGTSEACDDSEAFDHALARAQAQFEVEHPAPSAEEIAEREAFRAAESDATYGGTAQSSYQMKADAIEEARLLSAAFEQGMGEEVAAFLRDIAGQRVVIAAPQGEPVEAHLSVNSAQGAISAAAVDIVALRDSTVNVSIVVDGNVDDEEGAVAPSNKTVGITGTTLRVFADEGAHVRIARTQTLGCGFTDIDDMGLLAQADSRIEVVQFVLGADETFTGLAGDLRGDSAHVKVDVNYLGCDEQARDFNYILRHHGARTQCNINANGALAGKSTKTLRGTIDFIQGCKGAEGSEKESVLLVDDGVRNKTVPVILCNEDDVAGNHGATIGHIREEQLFYLESRGISREAAEAMFVSAALERAAIEAAGEDARDAVLRFGERLSPGFRSLFD